VTKVLLTGAGGQDGYYLAHKLCRLGYEVYGVVRPGDPARYKYLTEVPFLSLVQADLLDYPSLMSVATVIYPDIIINTAGLTSPAACWGTPELAFQVNGLGAVRLLETYASPNIKFIQFGSIADFGPYGASKQYAQVMMDDYRNRGFATTTIRFAGHHSPRRSGQFFSKKVVSVIAGIKRGEQGQLHLGDLSRSQDWGAAPDFMDAVIEILDMEPGTYTVGTGDPYTLEEFVKAAFLIAELNMDDHVVSESFHVQPYDVASLSAGPDARLSWRPQVDFLQLVDWLVTSELEVPGVRINV